MLMCQSSNPVTGVQISVNTANYKVYCCLHGQSMQPATNSKTEYIYSHYIKESKHENHI